MRLQQPVRIGLAIVLLAIAAAHVTWSVRYAWASVLAQEDTAPALERAIQLVPADATYYARLGALDPGNRVRWLDKAIQLNPTDPLFWIERSVNQELSGNAAAAERSLLESARLDHQYVPRWTLAAFYFRQRNVPQFQIWAHKALEMAWGDALPLFQMAGQLGISLDDVRRTMLPDRPPVLSAFLYECLRRNDFDETARAARRLIEIGTVDYRNTVLGAVDALFAGNRSSDAVAIWNQAVAAHWMPHSTLDPLAGRSLANPEFSFDFLPGGFDWRMPTLDGVVYWRLGNGRGLQIEFSGRQPESCTLLTLAFPYVRGHTYNLRTIAASANIAPDSGLKWRLGTLEWEAAKEMTENFEPPANSPPLFLTLVYNRALGTKRIEGTVTIQRVNVQ